MLVTIGEPAEPNSPWDLEQMFRRKNSVLTLKPEWGINNRKSELYLHKIAHLLTPDRLRIVHHEDIAWAHYLSKNREGTRYDKCDISYPGIVCEGAPNIYDKKYLLIDGAHRMGKMDHMKITESSFYVIEYAILRPFFIFPS